jgi:hypothetical protein
MQLQRGSNTALDAALIVISALQTNLETSIARDINILFFLLIILLIKKRKHVNNA